MFKNILFGLGSVGVVGGGAYMIYNATRSGDEGSNVETNGEGTSETSGQPSFQTPESQGSGSSSGSSSTGNTK